MIAPLCAFCVDSPATTTAEWTDATRGTSRIVHACAECALQAIPPERPDGAGRAVNSTTSQRAVFIEALRTIGPSTIGEVAKAAHATLDSARNNLSGLVMAGVAIAEPSPIRSRGRRPLLYRLKESQP